MVGDFEIVSKAIAFFRENFPEVKQVALGKGIRNYKARRGLHLIAHVERKEENPSNPLPKQLLGFPVDVKVLRKRVPLRSFVPTPDVPIGSQIRPGCWLGTNDPNNWGSLGLILKDQINRLYIITARHAISAAPAGELGTDVFIPSDNGGPSSSGITGIVRKVTNINRELFDVALVEVTDPGSLFSNVPYGLNTRVSDFLTESPEYNSSANFSGARTSFGMPLSGPILEWNVVPSDIFVPPGIPVQWICFGLSLQEGDSGGLFSTGKNAVAILMWAPESNGSAFYPVYGVPLFLAIELLKGPDYCLFDQGYSILNLEPY